MIRKKASLPLFVLFAACAWVSQAQAFGFMPKAERRQAEALLSGLSAQSSKSAFATTLAAIREPVETLMAAATERRLHPVLAESGSGKGPAPDGPVLSALSATCRQRAQALSFAADESNPPRAAAELAALIRRHGPAATPAALDKCLQAILNGLPRGKAESLKTLGKSFRQGGPKAYAAYIACLCESWMRAPEPFQALGRAEALSLNDSRAALQALAGLESQLSLKRRFLKLPWAVLCPPWLFGVDRRANASLAAECAELVREALGPGPGDPDVMGEDAVGALRDFRNFLLSLPESRRRSLFEGLGLPESPPEGIAAPLAPAEGDAASSEKSGREALKKILAFQAGLEGQDGDAARTAAYALVEDRIALSLALRGTRYGRLGEKLEGFILDEASRAAEAMDGSKGIRAFASVTEEGAFVAFVRSDASLSAMERVIGPESLPENFRSGIGRYALGASRILSLEPLVAAAEEEGRAIAWRYAIYGGAE